MKFFKYGITVFDSTENTAYNKFACRVSSIDYLDITLVRKLQVGYTRYYYQNILSLGCFIICWER